MKTGKGYHQTYSLDKQKELSDINPLGFLPGMVTPAQSVGYAEVISDAQSKGEGQTQHSKEPVSLLGENSCGNRANEGKGNASFWSDGSRDEMNLAEFPLAVLSSRTNPNVKTLEFSDIQRLRTGEVIERSWTLTGADKFGLPTSTDDDVVLGLIQLTKDRGFRDRKIYFTRYELLKALRWSTEGRSYGRLTKSLDRLSGVRIKAANAFYDNSTKAYQTVNFGIIDAYEINDSRGGGLDSEQPKSFFIWSEKLFNSFKSGYIKKLDLDLYFSLSSSVSRRLYRYLDKHTYYRSTIERNLMSLAFEKLGLSRTYKYVSSIKQQIKPALDELQRIGFLESFDYYGLGKETFIRLTVSRSVKANLPGSATSQEKDVVKESNDVLLETRRAEVGRLLSERGLSPSQINKLLLSKSELELQRIVEIVQHFDSLLKSQDAAVRTRNPIGFLYKAVENPLAFALPSEQRPRSDKAAGGHSSRSKTTRPEFKLVNPRQEERTSSSPSRNHHALPDSEKESFQAYQRFLDAELEKGKVNIPQSELYTLRARAEQRLLCLRSVLSPERFDQAVEGSFDDELRRVLGIPDYRTWLKLEKQLP